MSAAPAQRLAWRAEGVAIGEVREALGRLRLSSESGPILRTSVMTHLAWAPKAWIEAAAVTLEGLGERHPSRTILLVPEPDAGVDRIDAEVELRGFELEGAGHHVSTEVVRLSLLGSPARAPASVVLPLVRSDLPVFLRWRGEPDFAGEELRQLVEVADRLVVDSGEWDDPGEAYPRLAGLFERVAVSDIAWRRLHPWRLRLARLWPAVGTTRDLVVTGPSAEALLLAGWLRSRLERELVLAHVPSDTLGRVAVDGADVEPPDDGPATPSELLSGELDQFARDRVYEAAVRAAR